jgi:hypothetical protein
MFLQISEKNAKKVLELKRTVLSAPIPTPG